MAEYIKVALIRDIPSGSMKTLVVGGKKVAIANVAGEFFAIDDRCSHQDCSLGTNGFLDEIVVICGCHGAQFDVTNGEVLSFPATQPVTSYQTKIEENDIYIYV